MEDRLLVGALRSGSPDAIGAVYDTYADRLHDYCWFQLQDRDAAQVALRDTLMCAEAHVGLLRVPARFGPWLYALARIECRRRCGPAPERPDIPVARHDQDDADLRMLVWRAITGLPPLSRELLALRHRHALPLNDIASVTGLPAREIRELLDQADLLLEAALFAEILAYDGAFECARRALLLRRRDGELDDDLRERLVRHAVDCDVCARHLPRHISAAKVCELLPRAVPSAALRAHVLGCFTDPALAGYRLFAASRLRAFTTQGFPEQPGTGRSAIPRPAARRWPRALIALTGALIAALVAANIARWLGHEPDRARVVRADSAPPWTRVPSPGPALPPGPPGPPGIGHPVSATFPFGPFASPHPAVPGAAPGGLPMILISAPGQGRLQAWPWRLAICAGGTGSLTVRASGGPVMWRAEVAGAPGVEPASGFLDEGETGRLTVRVPAGAAGSAVIAFWPGGARVTVTWCARPGPPGTPPPDPGTPQPPPSSPPPPSPPPPSSPPPSSSSPAPHSPSPEPPPSSAPPPSAPPAPSASAASTSPSAGSARPPAEAASSPAGGGPGPSAPEPATSAGHT